MERRKTKRVKMYYDNYLIINNKKIPCKIKNLSIGGALVELDPKIISDIKKITGEISIETKYETEPDKIFKGKIVRIEKNLIGIEFRKIEKCDKN